MKTFNSAFKQVYEAALSEYGFRKIKGKYPYYVRLIGDEIVHIITYMNEWCPWPGYKAFNVIGGIATVYRGRIELDKSPKYNAYWLESNSNINAQLNFFNMDEEYLTKIRKFEYETENEENMIAAINYSLEVTKQNLLPELNKVQSLEDCIDYFSIFEAPLLFINPKCVCDNKRIGYETDEELLCMLVFGSEKYEELVNLKWEIFNRADKKEKYMIEIGKYGLTMEEQEKGRLELEQRVFKQIENYEMMVKDPEWQKKIAEELELRKTVNHEILRNHGFEI